jgi:photosystem II stability/assembly factor-like uncharacterized protein
MKYFFMIIYLLAFLSLSAQIIWEQQESGTIQKLNSVDFIDADLGIVVGDSGTILHTEDGGENWLQSESGTTQDLYSVCFINENNAVAVGAGPTILRSENSGANWTSITVNGLIYNLFSVYVHPEGNGIAGGDAQTILKTNDGGLNWEIEQTDYWGGGFWGAQMVDNNVGILAGENSIMAPLLAITTDGGDYFDFEYFYLVDGYVSYEGKSLNCYFFDSQSGIVVSRRWDGWGCVTRVDLPIFSTDHYITMFNSVDFMNDESGLVVGENGYVLFTDDAGLQWEIDVSGYPDFMDVDFPTEDNVAFIVGDQGTIVVRRSAVYNFDTEVLQNQVNLWSHPNPISGNTRHTGTRIYFELVESSQIELTIYDIKGRFCKVLKNEYYSTGTHDIFWDASKNAAGIYICLLKSKTGTTAHKIVKLQ